MSVYSPSRLGTYQNCPQQYKFQYIDKVEVEEVEGIEAFMGGIVHEVLHKLYLDLRLSNLNTIEDLLKHYKDLWEKGWHDGIQIIKKGYTKENYFQTGERCLRDYYKRYHPFKEKTIWLEERVAFKLDPEGKYQLQGYIDRLDAPKDGVYEVHDYKTGSMPKPEDLEEDRQLSLYQIGVMQAWPDAREVKLVWHYLAVDKEIILTKTPKELEAIRKETIKLIDEIESEKEFKPIVGPLCDWCAYSDICPAMGHQAKVEELPPNKYLKDSGVKLVNRLTELKAKKSEVTAGIQDKVEAIGLKELKEGHVLSTYGTDFDCVFQHAREHRFRRVLVITDGFADLRSEDPVKDQVEVFLVLTVENDDCPLIDVAGRNRENEKWWVIDWEKIKQSLCS